MIDGLEATEMESTDEAESPEQSAPDNATVFLFSPEAMRLKRSINFHRGEDIALHIVFREATRQLILNNRVGGVWGREVAVTLDPDQLDRDVSLAIAILPQGTAVSLAGAPVVSLPGDLAIADTDACTPHEDIVVVGRDDPDAGVKQAGDAPGLMPGQLPRLERSFSRRNVPAAGVVDHIDPNNGLAGWVIDRDRPGVLLTVEARCGGETVAQAVADVPRRDLARATDPAPPLAGYTLRWSDFDLDALERIAGVDRAAPIAVIVPDLGVLPVIFGEVTAALALRTARMARQRRAPAAAAARKTPSQIVEALFDTRLYTAQLDELGLTVPIERQPDHYAELGWRLRLDPHPLFRTDFYVSRHPEAVAAGQNPFLHYVAEGYRAGDVPHPALAGSDLVRVGAPGDAINAYLALALDARPKLYRSFSQRFYEADHPGVDWTVEDALLHYLSIGWRQGAMPNPGFDPAYYTATHMSAADAAAMSPIEHFEGSPQPRAKPFALFDPACYLESSADLKDRCKCAASHFLESGVWERRQFSPFKLDAYFYETFPATSFADRPPIADYLRSGRGRFARFICVGHESSRTGAPGIILKIAQHLASYSGVECLSILDQPGPLVLDHARCSPTLVPQHHRINVYSSKSTKQQLFDELDQAFAAFADNPPLGVFCNSAESGLYAEYFHSRGVPVIMLMHEIAGFYSTDYQEGIARHSDRIVFPAEYVAGEMRAALQRDSDRFAVIPQGLLREGFGDVVTGSRRTLFAEYDLEIGDDDIVVLGCGTIDGRKGFDLFLQTAHWVRQRRGARVKFVWVGGKPSWRMGQGAVWDSTGYWASWDLKRLDLDEVVAVVNEVANPEPFFTNADLFLMSSRADPFPCVVHEAMAARLPILAFDNAGGAPEAILPDGGVTVPYLDVSAMADAIIRLADDAALRASMGAVVRERVLTTYRFDRYVERLIALMREAAPAVADMDLGARDVPAVTRPKIFYTVPAWTASSAGTLPETLMRALADQGFDASVLLSTGKHGVTRGIDGAELVPDAPFRYLQPARNTPAEIAETLLIFLTANAPCTLILGDDPAAKALLGKMPPRVSTVGFADRKQRVDFAEIYRLGRDLDAIITASDETREALLAMNPVFADKVHVVPLAGRDAAAISAAFADIARVFAEPTTPR